MSMPSPIHKAIAKGDIVALGEAISQGCAVDASAPEGRPVLFLLNPDKSHERVFRRQALGLLLAAGASPSRQSNDNFPPLVLAASLRDKVMVSLLLKAGASPHETSQTGMTPLHASCAVGSRSTTSFLLERGSLVDAQDEAGRSPLHLAVRNEHHRIFRLLHDAGANWRLEDKRGMTPLSELALRSPQSAHWWECRPAAEALERVMAPSSPSTRRRM